MEISEKAKSRFWKKVVKTPNIGNPECWNWTGASAGLHGGLWFNGKIIRAHRFSYMLHKGEIKDGLVIMHTCDNYKCVNPYHLIAGTQRENMMDCLAKGRHHCQKKNTNFVRGEGVKQSKLTESKVVLIRMLLNEGCLIRRIAHLFFVDEATIRRIRDGESWNHVVETAAMKRTKRVTQSCLCPANI